VLILLLLAAAVLPSDAARAQVEAAGRVKTVEGEAWLTSETGERRAAVVGAPVARGDKIETGSDGSVGITFRDETRVSVGPGSQVAIDDFLYAPEADQLSFGASVARGTLLYVSGAIARMAPERVKVSTPEGTVGIRGTTFLVRVEEHWWERLWPW
jgi:hypothetical protein